MSDTSLLIVDVQVNMFDESFPVFNGEQILSRIESLIRTARESDLPVVFIRHNGNTGDLDEPGSLGWQIHPQVAPDPDDLIVNKTCADAFENTGLQEELEARGIGNLIVAGMQTEVCITSTCNRARELGYCVTLVKDAHSTLKIRRRKRPLPG